MNTNMNPEMTPTQDPNEINQVLAIGRQHFPEASDQELLDTWQIIKQKSPEITPQQVAPMLSQIAAQVKTKMNPGNPIPDQNNKLNTLASMGNIVRR